ncbi:ribonuclease J [Bacillus testis]|uniref:ribonuclease J n=1 Tax=Bacillus testis TaxID=1622072 RepID=UPI00067F4FAE|nr:ribonuclease J [Bacillus testis]
MLSLGGKDVNNQTAKNKIKVTALGGQGELGKNMYAIEVDEQLFVLDAGLMFPEEEMLGIDVVIPDTTYLMENKEKLQGIFISHGHEDHIGALPYILNYINVPIYGTKLTIELIKLKMKEVKFKKKIDFVEIDHNAKLLFGDTSVSFFRTNHSIPGSLGICIHTEKGCIVYTGDFKFDQAATGLYAADLGKLAQIGEEGVLLLLSDSTGAEKPGNTASEAIVERNMTDVFQASMGRVIVTTFASNINTIQHTLNAAAKSNRKVVIIGQEIKQIYDICMHTESLVCEEDQVIPLAEMNDYDDRQIAIITSGAKGEPISAMERMAKKNHKQISLRPDDTVIVAASPVRGGELMLTKAIDLLYRADVNVVSKNKTVYVQGHGSQDELKLMINLLKPQFFMPIHGEYRMLIAHEKVAKESGIPADSIIIAENGETVEVIKNHIAVTGKVASGNILIDGSGIGDVGNIVLRDRRLLSQDGILIVVVTLDKVTKAIVSGPEIITRGFVYVRESEKLIDQSVTLVKEAVEKNVSTSNFDWSTLKQDVRDALNSHLYEVTKRRPMILPIIMEI